MPQVSTHLLGSTDGYTTLAHSPDLSAPEIRELEDLMHGQAEEPAIRANLDKRPTALLRRLQSSGRYAISRILAGQQDSTGRETIAVCTIVLDPKAFSQAVAGDMWGLLKAPQLWKIQNFSSSRNFSIPDIAPVTRAVTQNDALLFDTWVQSRNTANGLGVIDNAEVFEQALVNLGQVLHPEDRLAYMWGCHLLSPQSPAQLASFANPNVVHRGRRSVVQPSATPQTSQGQTALQSVGKTQLPSSRATPIPAKSSTSAWGDGQGDIGLEETLTPRATRGMRWSQPNSTTQPRPALPMTWLAVGAASLIVLAGSVLFGIRKYKRDQPPMPDTQVTATKDKPDTVEITWVAGERAATHTVERSEASASPLSWESLGEQASPFRDKTGKPGIKYVYRVKPASPYGVQGEASNSAQGVRPPAMPGAITVTGAGKQARIKWDPVQGAAKYSVEWVVDPRPASNQDTSNASIEVELQPGETLASVKVVALSSENVPSQSGTWNEGFTQTKTARPDAISAASIVFECADSVSGHPTDLRVTWKAPESCSACYYELEITSRLTPTASPTIKTVTSPEYTIVGAGKYETVTVSITAKAKDTLGNPLSSPKAEAEWSACPIPTDFGLKAGTEWNGDSFEVTWTTDPDVIYSVKLSDGTKFDQQTGENSASIPVPDQKVTEVTVELVCVKQGACPRSTKPITIQRTNPTPPPPTEPTFPQALKDTANRFLEIESAAEPAAASDTQLREQMNDALGLKDHQEFNALRDKDKDAVRVAAKAWLNCVCGIAKAQVEDSNSDTKKLAGQLIALQRAESFLLSFLEVNSKGLNLDNETLSEIEGVLKLGDKRFRKWLESRYLGTDNASPRVDNAARKSIWIDGLDRLRRDSNKFVKDLTQPGNLYPPTETAGKNKQEENARKHRDWKELKLPTWVDLAIYACIDDPPLKKPARSDLARALEKVAKDSKDLSRAVVSLSEFPLFDYALKRVEATNP